MQRGLSPCAPGSHRRRAARAERADVGLDMARGGPVHPVRGQPTDDEPAQAQPRPLRGARGSHRPGRGPAPLRVGPAGPVRRAHPPVPSRARDRRAGRGPVRDHRSRPGTGAVSADADRWGAGGGASSHRRARRSLRRHKRDGRRGDRARVRDPPSHAGARAGQGGRLLGPRHAQRTAPRRHRRQRRGSVGAAGGPARGRRAANRFAGASLRGDRAGRSGCGARSGAAGPARPRGIVLRQAGGRGAARRPVRSAGDAVGARRSSRGFPRAFAAGATGGDRGCAARRRAPDSPLRDRRPAYADQRTGRLHPRRPRADRAGAGRARPPRDRGLLDLRDRVRRRRRGRRGRLDPRRRAERRHVRARRPPLRQLRRRPAVPDSKGAGGLPARVCDRVPVRGAPGRQTVEDLAAVRPSARARRGVRRAIRLGAACVVPQRPRGRARGVQLPESQLARSRQGRV